jgi:CheY-like chemotaxis protein
MEVLRRRVLIVDDDAESADALRALVEIWGHEAEVAYDGATALRLARQDPPHVVILDLGLPDVDGCEVARALRVRPSTRSIAIIVLTGYGDDEDIRRSDRAGSDAFVLKPGNLDRLRDLLLTLPAARRTRKARGSG